MRVAFSLISISLFCLFASEVQADVIVNRPIEDAQYNSEIHTSTYANPFFAPPAVFESGLAFNVTFTPAAGDLINGTPAVLLVEIGGASNGAGLYLQDGRVWFISKMNGFAKRLFTGVPDLDYENGPYAEGDRMIAVRSGFNNSLPLAAGTEYTAAVEFHPNNDFLELSVKAHGGTVFTEQFVLLNVGDKTNLAGDLSVTSFAAAINLGGTRTDDANCGWCRNAINLNLFEGTKGQALYWNADPNANEPPIAVAGADQAIRAGDSVALDGSDSFDDNTASASLIYSWSFSTLPAGSSAFLTGANTATPSFVADVADTYVVELIVTDEGGLSSVADEVIISGDNLAPTADATVDFSLAILGNAVNFDGSGSTDPELDALTYSWSITGAPIGSTAVLVGDDTANPSLTADVEGSYEVTLTVSDFIGPGTPATVSIVATTASGFAEIVIVDASDQVGALTAEDVTTAGNQNAFGNFLAQAISLIQEGDTAGAIDKLNKAIERTDGWALRGSADGNGPGRDWITDSVAQLTIYDLLTDAVDALQP